MTIDANSHLTSLAGMLNRANDIMGALTGQPKGRGGVNINTGSGDDVVNYVAPPPHHPPHPQPGHTPPDQEPVAANERGRIWSDPHFLGGDSGVYDIQGEAGKNYNLVSDEGLQLNGRFDVYDGDGTAVGETGLTLTGKDGSSSQLTFSKDGSAELDGQKMVEGKTYDLADGGTAQLKGDTLTTTTAEGYTIEQQAKEWGDKYINIDVKTGDQGVGNGRMPGGLLGQTFDADNDARNGKLGKGAQGEGAIEGVVTDYEMDGLLTAAPQTTPSSHGPITINTGSGDDTVIIGPHGPAQEPEPMVAEPVAANESGRVWGDPHFVGGDGGKYDVQGEAGKIYDLLSDTGLDLRGRFDQYGQTEGLTVVGETGLTVGEGWNSDNIEFRKDGTANINDHVMEEGKTYDLADGGTAKLENGSLTVTTAEGYTINQTTKGSGDKAHINIDVSTGDKGVDNGKMPGGLLGQTFDADNEARNGKTGKGAQGEGAIEGKVADYEKSSLDPVRDGETGAPTVDENSEFKQLMSMLENVLEQLSKLLEQFNDGEASPQDSPTAAPQMETNTNTGSGDDTVEIITGGKHNIELGSGDDKTIINLQDDTGESRVNAKGGSGDDEVILAGSESDYTVNEEDGNTLYTDQDGNVITVADDVEEVSFENMTAR